MLLWGVACSRSPASPPAVTTVSCDTTRHGARLQPVDGVWFGVNLDWSKDSPASYAQRLGRHPAVLTSFAPVPLQDPYTGWIDAAVESLAQQGGMLLLTLEPHTGLDAIDAVQAESLARRLAGYNARGVLVLLRFAHEMNGSWYAWSQQPEAYVAAYRRVAEAVHRLAPGTAMLWAPNYGGGYPFRGGKYEAEPDSAAAELLDTDGDGEVTQDDDPYAPYYPGDDAVDWVGMSLYHWGNHYPWGSNELPEAGKFEAMLRGSYRGLVGDERGVPDFYGEFGERRGKPVGIFETAALYAPGRGGAAEFELKSQWWRQVYAPDIAERYPRLKMINWFEWDKYETEIDGRVDWGVTTDPRTRDAYLADLPKWLRFAEDIDFCARP